ncbi:MAG TPA: hypothetical protein DDW85_03135 [Porphyromonadaceae bacterium]|nr:hypothetical protein [Porphyromonadaceae bacterium]
MGYYCKLVDLKIILIFLSFLLTFELFSQSIEDIYDLRFESFSKSYRGDWTNSGKMIKFSIDSSEFINEKYPLKISSIQTQRNGVLDKKREVLLSRTITLPQYEYGDKCTVFINSKSEDWKNWKFEIRG